MPNRKCAYPKLLFVQIIVGWSVARFGLFGTRAQQVHSPLLNYLGVVLTLLSGLIFVFVYSRDEQTEGEGEQHNKVVPRQQKAPLNTAPGRTIGGR